MVSEHIRYEYLSFIFNHCFIRESPPHSPADIPNSVASYSIGGWNKKAVYSVGWI